MQSSINVSWKENLHRAGHEGDDHLYQKDVGLWDPDLVSITGIMKIVLVRKT